jgi:hypothetical protein
LSEFSGRGPDQPGGTTQHLLTMGNRALCPDALIEHSTCTCDGIANLRGVGFCEMPDFRT